MIFNNSRSLFKDNKFNGKGTASYYNGAKYVGMFKNGKKEGEGIYISSTGKEHRGIWKNDKPYPTVEEYFGPWAIFLPEVQRSMEKERILRN